MMLRIWCTWHLLKKNLHNIIDHLSKKSGEGKAIKMLLTRKYFSLYWLFKEEIAVSKAVSLLSLTEKLGVYDNSSIETCSIAKIGKIALLLQEIIKGKSVAKIKESHVYACFQDEETHISNMQNLLFLSDIITLKKEQL